MRSFRPLRNGSLPAALPALLSAIHLLGLALGSSLGLLRESGATAARMFERAEEQALLLRMMREAAGILGARWDKVPRAPASALRPRAAVPDPAYSEFPRAVTTRDGRAPLQHLRVVTRASRGSRLSSQARI